MCPVVKRGTFILKTLLYGAAYFVKKQASDEIYLCMNSGGYCNGGNRRYRFCNVMGRDMTMVGKTTTFPISCGITFDAEEIRNR